VTEYLSWEGAVQLSEQVFWLPRKSGDRPNVFHCGAAWGGSAGMIWFFDRIPDTPDIAVRN